MGKMDRPWQDTAYVLTLFGKTFSEARGNLQKHVLSDRMRDAALS